MPPATSAPLSPHAQRREISVNLLCPFILMDIRGVFQVCSRHGVAIQATKLIRSRSGISPTFPYCPIPCSFLNHKRGDPRFRPAPIASQESAGGKQQPREPAGREHGGTTNPTLSGLLDRVICERWAQYCHKPAIRNGDCAQYTELAQERRKNASKTAPTRGPRK